MERPAAVGGTLLVDKPADVGRMLFQIRLSSLSSLQINHIIVVENY